MLMYVKGAGQLFYLFIFNFQQFKDETINAINIYKYMRAQDRQLDASADYCYAVLGFQDMELG